MSPHHPDNQYESYLRGSYSVDPRIQIAISTIENQFSHEVDNEALGRLVNISASHMRHLFKSETGLTPRQYLKRVRLQKAQLLLRTTFLSVKQVMNRVGIGDDSYFSREFRKTYGVAPGKYRKLYEGSDSNQVLDTTTVNE